MIDIFKIFKRKKRSDVYNSLMDDWGKSDVYGPWTKNMKGNIPTKEGEFKFYKSYWLITYGGEPNIDLLPPYDESDFNS